MNTLRFQVLVLMCLGVSCLEPTSPGRIASVEKTRSITAGIQPFGDFSPALADSIRRVVEAVFGFDAVVLKPVELPEAAFVNIKSPRYRADKLLPFLKTVIPDSVDYILGLTAKDISTTKKDAYGKVKQPESRYFDWGVCGLGYRPGPCAVVSTFRLKTADKTRFMERFRKTCIHELGHNLGLPHCDRQAKCVMRDAAETVKTIDGVDLWLCEDCQKDLGIENSPGR